eukprot:TRINITY_DN18675_c0_g3_i1.p1 TRINITY_DN18675_c0_g3~~TRINITY_DN18675_c0_g3_i1.p1  ORF type:complete len:577 (-),score=200.68 TRINITY_DN18675_c0_g3_i1:171-1901(-)
MGQTVAKTCSGCHPLVGRFMGSNNSRNCCFAGPDGSENQTPLDIEDDDHDARIQQARQDREAQAEQDAKMESERRAATAKKKAEQAISTEREAAAAQEHAARTRAEQKKAEVDALKKKEKARRKEEQRRMIAARAMAAEEEAAAANVVRDKRSSRSKVLTLEETTPEAELAAAPSKEEACLKEAARMEAAAEEHETAALKVAEEEAAAEAVALKLAEAEAEHAALKLAEEEAARKAEEEAAARKLAEEEAAAEAAAALKLAEEEAARKLAEEEAAAEAAAALKLAEEEAAQSEAEEQALSPKEVGNDIAGAPSSAAVAVKDDAEEAGTASEVDAVEIQADAEQVAAAPESSGQVAPDVCLSYPEYRMAHPGPILGGIFNKDPVVTFAQAVERSDPQGLVPWPLRRGCAWIEEHGVETEGVFRIPGSTKNVKAWVVQMNDDPEFDLGPPGSEFTVPSVCSMIIKFLMGQKRGWWTGIPPEEDEANKATFHKFAQLAKALRAKKESRDKCLEEIREALRELPPSPRETIKTVSRMMYQISKHHEVNLMTPPKLALCVGTNLGPLAETMFEEYEFLFES